jgi:chemotaxis protein methyltransferase CheR
LADLTMAEFELLSSFIYKKTGILFEYKKMYFIARRIQTRMTAMGIDNIPEYINLLNSEAGFGDEFHHLTELCTINETYFFRDFPQLQAFAECCLVDVCKRKNETGDQKLRIWSAACSSGEEPYTLAIIFLEMLDNYRYWDIEIIASDIDRQVLEKAQKGEYKSRSVKDVPPEYFKKYFTPKTEDPSVYVISNEVKNFVTFENVNLSNRAEIRHHLDFDFIFCRNLLIYFDDVSRKNLVDQFYIALNPGGYIFLGSSESVSRMSTAFNLKKVNGFLVYQK